MTSAAALVLILLTLHAAAADDDFSKRCEALAHAADIDVIFKDAPIILDVSRSVADLQRLAGPRTSPYHHVLGLTHGEPTVAFQMIFRHLSAADGTFCAAPSLAITLGFAPFQVYLARELADPCHRDAVYRHELEHVAAWRDHFRAGTSMLRPLLHKDLAGPYYLDAADEGPLREEVRKRLSPLLLRLREGVVAAQLEIDSPGSYRHVESRLRSCP